MSTFILTLKLDTETYQEDILNKRLEIGRNIYNACLNELKKRYRTMQQSKEYQKVCKMAKGKERNKLFNSLNKKYGLTEYSLTSYVKPMQHHFKKNIDSFTSQAIAKRCFLAFQKLMLHKSKKIKFKRHGEMNSLEGKSNKTGIRFIEDKLIWNGLIIPVINEKNDVYTQMALINKIKYCRVVRKLIRGRYKFYIQLVLEGIPPIKIDKDTGEIKNPLNIGDVGIDIGTQTIAISSDREVKLLELASEIRNIDREKRILSRKLDRQRRANNPDKYNEDGTIKRNKLKWNNSKRYLKTKNELAEIQRKLADIRKQSHNKLANYVLSLGNKVYVEEMNFKGLKSRSKKTTVNKKTGKINKKKRFGKSIGNKAPSMFLTILDNKLKWHGERLLKVDTYKIKASQYNHVSDEYIKKGLSERWNDFGEYKIQRDMYSAFIIMCSKENLKETDKEKCKDKFSKFKEMHDAEVLRIKGNESKIIGSMGM